MQVVFPQHSNWDEIWIFRGAISYKDFLQPHRNRYGDGFAHLVVLEGMEK